MLPPGTPDTLSKVTMGLDLAVVVPTYKERENVVLLFQRLDRVLAESAA